MAENKKIIYLNWGERYEDMPHHLSNYEIIFRCYFRQLFMYLALKNFSNSLIIHAALKGERKAITQFLKSRSYEST